MNRTRWRIFLAQAGSLVHFRRRKQRWLDAGYDEVDAHFRAAYFHRFREGPRVPWILECLSGRFYSRLREQARYRSIS